MKPPRSLRSLPPERLSPGRSEDSCVPPRGADAVLRGRGPTYKEAVSTFGTAGRY
jgi:hypothetical protein